MRRRLVCSWCYLSSSTLLLRHQPSDANTVTPATESRSQSFANRNHRSPLTRDDYDANNNKSKSPGPLVTINFKELSSLMTILTTNDFYWQDLIPRHPRLRRLFSPLERIWRKDARLTQQPLQSKKRQMYLTCFAIVFLW
jgi:hypothetical protein